MYAEIPFGGDARSDRDLIAVVKANPECRLELSSDGKILVRPLTGTAMAPKEGEAYVQLHAWTRQAGGKAYGAAAGFRLPDNSVLGPDASWISPERLLALMPAARDDAFWHVCPDVVIEVMSESDSWPRLMKKIGGFMTNGAVYAVAIDCNARRVYERGAPPVGLHLDFEAIFDA